MAALVAHNNLIEKAKWANFGSVIEQEGDSYSLIFEEAGDAVKFCLQVRFGSTLGRSLSRRATPTPSRGSSLIFEEAGDAVKFCLQVGLLLENLGNYVRAKSFGLTTSLPSIASAWFSVSPEAVPHVRSG